MAEFCCKHPSGDGRPWPNDYRNKPFEALAMILEVNVRYLELLADYITRLACPLPSWLIISFAVLPTLDMM